MSDSDLEPPTNDGNAKVRQRGTAFIKLALTIVVIGLVFLAFGAFVALREELIDRERDIPAAIVVDKYKTDANRRNLPHYYLVIQEPNKDPETIEIHNLGTWSICDVGKTFRDVPGEDPHCPMTSFPLKKD